MEEQKRTPIYTIGIGVVMAIHQIQTEESRIVTELIVPIENQIATLPDSAEAELLALQKKGMEIIRDQIKPLKDQLAVIYRGVERRAGLKSGAIETTHEIVNNVVYKILWRRNMVG